MSRPTDALNIAAFALAAALGLLAFMQWRQTRAFSADAVPVRGTIVELRTAKKAIFEADNDVFVTVEYTLDEPVGTRRAELVTPLAQMGVDGMEAVGTEIPLLVDPAVPGRPRYGRVGSSEAALVLLMLALGALFVPAIMRRSLLGGSGGG